jgi:imidazole glycerol-phosphate synthase subunit HisH
MISIIDYGIGNIQAFVYAFSEIGLDYQIARDSESVKKASKLILPGVGSFDYAMKKFNSSGLRDSVEELVLGKKIPVLGVCVGMQILFTDSEEGHEKGLGWMSGTVRKFRSFQGPPLCLPHMGWNTISFSKDSELTRGLHQASRLYFLHSYYVEPEPESIVATTDYNFKFASIVHQKNIHGVQPHPEKSHSVGLTLLKNFGEI